MITVKLPRLSFYVVMLYSCLHSTFSAAQQRPVNGKLLVTKDIAYKQRSGTALLLDVYRYSPTGKTLKPAIVFVHGGGFWEGDKRSAFYVKIATAFARRGYVSCSVNYTLKAKDQPYSTAILDTCKADVLAAVKWVRANSLQLGIDTLNFFICGDSAGGGIVVNTSYDPRYAAFFTGCIDLWGGLPGKQGWEAPVYDAELIKPVPPTCIIHGTADRVVPYTSSSDLSCRLGAAGVQHVLYPLKDADHYPTQLADRFIPLMTGFTDQLIKK